MGKIKLAQLQASKLVHLLGKDGYQVLQTSDDSFYINMKDKEAEKMDYNLRYNLINQEIMPLVHQEEFLRANFSEIKKGSKDYPLMHNVMSSAAFAYNLLSRISKQNVFKYKNVIGRCVSFEVELQALASIGTVKLDAMVPTDEGMIFFDVKYTETFKKKEYALLDRYFNREEHLDTTRETFSFWDSFFTTVLGDKCKESYKRAKEEGYLDLVKLVKHTMAIYNYVKSNNMADQKIYYFNVAFEVPEVNMFDGYEECRVAQLEARRQAEVFKKIVEDFMERLEIKFEFVYLSSEELLKYLNDDQVKEYYNERYYIGK